MQPEPTEVNQKSSSTKSSRDNSTASHHGLHETDQLALDNRSGGGRGEPWRLAGRDEAASAPAASSPPPFDSSIARLRSVSPPSPGERVAEHERATTYSAKKKNEGPTFTVVHRRKRSASGRCTITDFPNGKDITIYG